MKEFGEHCETEFNQLKEHTTKETKYITNEKLMEAGIWVLLLSLGIEDQLLL